MSHLFKTSHAWLGKVPLMNYLSFILTFTLLLLAACGGAQRGAPERIEISNVDFMLGCWRGTGSDGSTLEERYEPSGGTIVGHTTVTANGATVMSETTEIVSNSRTIELRSTVDGQALAPFTLQSQTDLQHAVFENLANDFPQRIIYARVDETTLTARIEGNTPGGEQHVEWTMHPCTP